MAYMFLNLIDHQWEIIIIVWLVWMKEVGLVQAASLHHAILVPG